jgi:hypothetical protein
VQDGRSQIDNVRILYVSLAANAGSGGDQDAM